MNASVARPGDVLRIAASDWQYGDGDLVLCVQRVRSELSRFYGGTWVWLEGYRLETPAHPPPWMQALVRASALPTSDPEAGEAESRHGLRAPFDGGGP